LPAATSVWSWVPWISVFGTWNSVMQVTLTTMAVGISILTWALALDQKKKACDYPF
jgi:hypothetical protein